MIGALSPHAVGVKTALRAPTRELSKILPAPDALVREGIPDGRHLVARHTGPPWLGLGLLDGLGAGNGCNESGNQRGGSGGTEAKPTRSEALEMRSKSEDVAIIVARPERTAQLPHRSQGGPRDP